MKNNQKTLKLISIFLIFFFLFVNIKTTLSTNTHQTQNLSKIERKPACEHPIYCNNELLYTVQMSGLFNDSKVSKKNQKK